MITQHLHAPVVPPSAHNSQIPPALDNLIVRLLAKEPDNRPESAAEALDLLENLDSPAEAEAPQKELTLLDRIVRGRMVGREQELADVKAIWSLAASGRGQTLLISGEPGVGKSSLTRELITQAEVSGGAAFIGECYAEAGAPYDPFAQIIRKALQNEDGSGSGLKALAGLELPDFVMADLLKLAPELQPYYQDIPANPALGPELEQRRLFENLVTFSKILSEKQPLVIVLEDAHWSDSGTMALMRHLVRRTQGLPVLIAATFREIELDEGLPFNSILNDLNRERLATWIKLRRFDRSQTEKMLEALFAEAITPEFLEAIYRETEGNPFFIEEVCKALVESGQVTYEDGAWQRPSMEEIAIPHSVRTAIQSRVSNLPDLHQEALRLAAILGREFDFEILSTASRLEEMQLIDILEEAERAQLIVTLGGVRFSFTHALIPSTLVESVHTLRRRILHRQAAAAIEALRPNDIEKLAYHFGEAGDDEKALHYFTLAGEQALNAFANPEAEKHFQSALVLADDEASEAHIRYELGIAMARLGRNQEAISIWEPAIEIAVNAGDDEQAARLFALAARAAWEGSDPKLGLEIAQRGVEALNDAQVSPGLADLFHETARALFFNGERKEGTQLIRKTLEMTKDSSDIRVRVEVLITFGTFAELTIEEKILILEKAIALAEANQLPDQEARACNNLAVHCGFGAGQFERARDLTKRAGELARATGSLAVEVFYLGNSILWDIYLGNMHQADQQLLDLLELSDEIGASAASQSMVKAYRSVLLRLEGNREEALRQLKQNYASAMDVNDSNIVWITAICIAELELELSSDLANAAEALQGALDLSYGGDVWPLCLLAMIYAQRGELDEAKSTLDKALAVDQEEGQLTDQIWLARARAHIAKFDKRIEDALAEMERAAVIADESGMTWYRAYIEMNLAKLLVLSDRNERAGELLMEARNTFEAVGAPGYVEEAESLLRGLSQKAA